MIKPHDTTPNLLQSASFIAIEGPVGSGKTSLARRLAEFLKAELLLENAIQNPFLERFYQNRSRWALATQIAFLQQRIELLQQWPTPESGRPLVTDFLLEKDELFAEVNLPEDEFVLYRKLQEQLNPSAKPCPDLVIYLQASPETLMTRIQRRGLSFERPVSESYLRKLSERYAGFFYDFDKSPLFIVDTSVLNPVDDESDFAMLIERLRDMRSYREFFGYA